MQPSPNLKRVQSNRWSGGALLETAHKLNERCLALLAKMAQAGRPVDWFASCKEIRALWAQPTERTVGRAARCPIVLLDFNFQRVGWWRRVLSDHSPPEGLRQAPGIECHTDESIPLARDLLMEAWSASRSMPSIASLIFGMAPQVTTLIAQLSPCDVDRVLVKEAKAMRPRWENQPIFWKELFHAARQMDDQILADVHLHCLQLLGGEWVANCGQSLLLAAAATEPMIDTSGPIAAGPTRFEPPSLEFR